MFSISQSEGAKRVRPNHRPASAGPFWNISIRMYRTARKWKGQQLFTNNSCGLVRRGRLTHSAVCCSFRSQFALQPRGRRGEGRSGAANARVRPLSDRPPQVVTPMVQVTAIIALSERLRKESRKARSHETIADLRLAARYLRALAVLKIAEEVEAETDPERKAQLEREFIQLYVQLFPLTLKACAVRGSPKALN